MRYSQIIYNDTANGEGLRISFFTQGCGHHCKNCFNQDTAWDFNGGKELTEEVLNEMFLVFKLYKNGYDGLSILGGDPFQNLEVSNLVVNRFRKMFGNTKTIWIYSGYEYSEIIKDKNKLELLKKCDVLVDGRFEEDKKDLTLKFRGSSNQHICDIRESLKQNKVIEYKY
jgi:anaerobic ribonucleoside-triphosphate reductase activating protein